MYSERYKKALVTVYMGLREEEDIQKNGLFRFEKKDKQKLINFANELFNRNKKILLLKIKPKGFRSEHIYVDDADDFLKIISQLDDVFDKSNEIWVVQSSAKECWRGRIYLSCVENISDRIEMAFSFDDHILDHVSENKNDVPYILLKKDLISNKFLVDESNLSQDMKNDVDKLISKIVRYYGDEFENIRNDMRILKINGISLDVRYDGDFDFHDFDVGYEEIEKVINFYVPR